MPIRFHCEHCHKEVQAPDAAGGRRGNCPYCGGSNYIPAPSTGEELPLAPLNEEEERQRQQEIERLLAAEKHILAETDREEVEPRLAHREPAQVSPGELHHFVVNFCLDMANGKLEQADVHVLKLNEYPGANKRAVRDFLDGHVQEPAMEQIPPKVREGFMKNLMSRLR